MTGSALRGTSALDVHFGPEAICLLRKEGVWGMKRAGFGSIDGRRMTGSAFPILIARGTLYCGWLRRITP